MLSLGLVRKGREYLKQIVPTMKLNEKSLELYATSPLGVDKKGYLNKKGEFNTEYQKRWFVLKGNLLYYFDKEIDRKPNGVIILDSCSVELADTGEPFAFQIVFSGEGSRNYMLTANSDEEMMAWMKALTHASFSYTKLLVDTFQAQLEALRNRDRSVTVSGINRMSKLRPLSLMQAPSPRPGRAITHDAALLQPLKPPRKVKEQRKVNNGECIQDREKDYEEIKCEILSIGEPSGSDSSTSNKIQHTKQLEVHDSEDRSSNENKSTVENLVPVDVNAIQKSRSDTGGSEPESTFYTVMPSAFNLNYFTPPAVVEYVNTTEPLCEDEIFNLPISHNNNVPDDSDTDTSSTMPRNGGRIRSRIHQLSRSERRTTTRRTRFHTDMDMWASSDDIDLLRARSSSFRSLHDSFGASIWVKVHNFEAAIEKLMKSKSTKH